VSRRSNGTAVLAAGAAAALLLAGCQSNPAPPPLDTAPSPTASSPAPSPSATPPAMPAEATGTSPAAAKAFVRHWVEILNYSGPALDHQAIRSVSSADCAACSAIAGLIEDVERDGGTIRGRGWKVQRMNVVSADDQTHSVVVDAQVIVSKQRIRPAGQASWEQFGGGRRLKTFWLKREKSGWLVERLDQPS
jgi:hypothetical protein